MANPHDGYNRAKNVPSAYKSKGIRFKISDLRQLLDQIESLENEASIDHTNIAFNNILKPTDVAFLITRKGNNPSVEVFPLVSRGDDFNPIKERFDFCVVGSEYGFSYEGGGGGGQKCPPPSIP